LSETLKFVARFFYGSRLGRYKPGDTKKFVGLLPPAFRTDAAGVYIALSSDIKDGLRAQAFPQAPRRAKKARRRNAGRDVCGPRIPVSER
jgi:hypothetical protein